MSVWCAWGVFLPPHLCFVKKTHRPSPLNSIALYEALHANAYFAEVDRLEQEAFERVSRC